MARAKYRRGIKRDANLFDGAESGAGRSDGLLHPCEAWLDPRERP
jgi:hypothetical protein